MLLLKSFASERSVDSASHPKTRFLPRGFFSPLLSLRIRVFHPNTRIYVRLLGPCFKTGGRKPFRLHREPTIWYIQSSIHLSHRQNFVLSRARANRPQCINALASGGLSLYLIRPQVRDAKLKQISYPKCTSSTLSDKQPNDADFVLTSSNPLRRKGEWDIEFTGFLPLPVNNFKYFLTLFSKFFSSFPHGTCSLSVSRQYLALDELYHPFSAALPSNATLGKLLVRA